MGLGGARAYGSEGNGFLPEPHSSTAIIGLGNPLRGDDGVGVRVAEILSARQLPPEVEVIDGGTQGLAIVNLMEGRQRVIFVDAANIGEKPGRFARFTLDEVALPGGPEVPGRGQYLNIHDAGLEDALLLARALHSLPEEVVVFGVQPASIDWKNTLSPEIEDMLPRLVDAILAELVVPE